jgi:hypothetical protein
MKIVRYLAVIGFLILTANIALADSAGDPKMYTTGGGHSVPITSLTNDPNFVINYTAGITPTVDCATYGGVGGNTCIFTDFINNTGQAWTGISFLITGVGGDVTQNSFSVDNSLDPYFTTAAVSFNNAGQAILSFFGTDPTHPGILPAVLICDGDCFLSGPYLGDIPLFDFGILTDVTDALNQGDSFSAQGSAAVPEPKTIVLLLAGAALVGLFVSKRAA